MQLLAVGHESPAEERETMRLSPPWTGTPGPRKRNARSAHLRIFSVSLGLWSTRKAPTEPPAPPAGATERKRKRPRGNESGACTSGTRKTPPRAKRTVLSCRPLVAVPETATKVARPGAVHGPERLFDVHGTAWRDGRFAKLLPRSPTSLSACIRPPCPHQPGRNPSNTSHEAKQYLLASGCVPGEEGEEAQLPAHHLFVRCAVPAFHAAAETKNSSFPSRSQSGIQQRKRTWGPPGRSGKARSGRPSRPGPGPAGSSRRTAATLPPAFLPKIQPPLSFEYGRRAAAPSTKGSVLTPSASPRAFSSSRTSVVSTSLRPLRSRKRPAREPWLAYSGPRLSNPDSLPSRCRI